MLAANGVIATSQPLASSAGLQVLQAGGNAIDAAVTAAAVLGVVEPTMTGVGGDVFALLYDGQTKTLRGLNSSGRAGARADADALLAKGIAAMPADGVYPITVPGAVAGWATKRRWVEEAFAALESAGYHAGSAYTLVKDPSRTSFVYRDRLWQGADLVGLGVASFGHVSGVHMQNFDQWDAYRDAVERGEIPLSRAYRPTDEERMIRELVLQLKRGWIRPAYFQDKYGVDVLDRFREPFASLRAEGYLAEASGESIRLSRAGLMRADVLLRRFFLPEHAGIRYT